MVENPFDLAVTGSVNQVTSAITQCATSIVDDAAAGDARGPVGVYVDCISAFGPVRAFDLRSAIEEIMAI